MGNLLLQSLSCSSAAYTRYSRSTGLSFTPTQVRCKGACLNRPMNNLNPMYFRILRGWFNCGVCLGIALMLLAPLVLGCSLFGVAVASLPWLSEGPRASPGILLPVYNGNEESRVLNPLIPGVTIPGFHIVYLFVVLLVSGVFHELGHALAASAESVRIESFGGFLMIFYPGAFVELHSGLLAAVRPWQQLRIFCAGIWHNAVIVIAAAMLLSYLPGLRCFA
jgi:S2P endopeptidase